MACSGFDVETASNMLILLVDVPFFPWLGKRFRRGVLLSEEGFADTRFVDCCCCWSWFETGFLGFGGHGRVVSYVCMYLC